MSRSLRRRAIWSLCLATTGMVCAGTVIGVGPAGAVGQAVAVDSRASSHQSWSASQPEPTPRPVHPVPSRDGQWPGRSRAAASATKSSTRTVTPAPTAVSRSSAKNVIALTGECPAGTLPGANLLSEDFESGVLPETKDTHGWSVTSEGSPASGARYATSTLTPSSDRPYHALFLPVIRNTTARTVLRFAVRGDYPQETAFVAVNDAGGWMAPSPSWGLVTLDITDVAAAMGEFDIRFLNYPKVIADSTRVEVDRVEVYRCEPVPATNVRGDFTGDGRADALAIDAAGVLWMLPGRPDGSLGDALRVGAGWEAMTWMGSPGDVTGDRRPDLLARRADGVLLRYAGRGGASFAPPVAIGRGWGGMTAILTPGDMTGGGRTQLVARDANGTLYRYTFAPGGAALTGATKIGVRFAGLPLMATNGDLNGDRRGDLLAVRTDGRMVSYLATARGTLAPATVIGTGWESFVGVSGPGDLDGDGRGDLLAKTRTGTVRVFLGDKGRMRDGRSAVASATTLRMMW